MKYTKNILIIDDMKHIRDILWFSLKQEGYRPILAKDGPTGLKYLRDEEQKIDLVILDVMMPRMDGMQVLSKIRLSGHWSSSVPVIMLTAKAQKEDVMKGLKKGASDYVLKPYKFEELLMKIKHLIG